MYLSTVFLWFSKKSNFKQRYLLGFMKGRSKVHEKNMSHKHALNFDESKIFSSNSKEVSYFFWQNKYSYSKSTCNIKPKFFFENKLFENLLLAKYLMSVTAALKWVSSKVLNNNYSQWTVNYCKEENNLLSYNRDVVDRFETDVASLFITFEKVRAFCEFGF